MRTETEFEIGDRINWFEAASMLSGPAEPPARTSRRPTLIGDLAPYWERYTDPAYQAGMRPLRVMIEVAGPIAGYDRPALDGLLARMVVDEALRGTPLDDTYSPYLLPVPLYRLWTHPERGLPLWACNHFTPAGPNIPITNIIHRRIIRPEMAREQKGQTTPYTIKGRHKERRVPIPAKTAMYLWSDCIGDAEEVGRLLGQVQALGKRRMGLVLAMAVEPIERFKMSRPVPLPYFEGAPVRDNTFCSWTPPYWNASDCRHECALPA